MFRALSSRFLFLANAIGSLSLLGGALILVEFEGVRPCYLCNLQRFFYLVIACFSVGGALFPARKKLAGILAGVAALGGLITAAYQSYLQINPDINAGCGIGEANLLERFMDQLGTLWPDMFMVTGNCVDKEWTFIGLSLANWSCLFFAASLISMLCLVFLVRRRA